MITAIKKQITQIKIRDRKGGLMLEYTVLAAIVIASLLSMHVYLRRAISGRWRQAADTFGHGRQYEPGGTR